MSTSTVAGILAESGGDGLEPGDVAVVVGAEHVDAQVESALALVEVVGDIGGHVGGLAVALDDDAVLVVAKVGGAQPDCAVLLVDAAGLAKFGDGLLDPAGAVHRVFVGVDVEVGAEVVQRLLDVGEHQVDADGAERLAHLVVGQAQRVGLLGEHLSGDLLDVVAGVAVVRRGFAFGGGDQRVGEPVDLGAVVVEVVLAHDVCALRGEQASERVADGGPPGAADVDGSGRVGGDELEVDVLALERVRVAVVEAGIDDVVDDDALGGRLDAQVDEAGACDVGGRDAVLLGQGRGQPAGQLTRVGTDLLAELKGDVGGVIAVFGIARALDGDGGRQRGRVEAMLGQHRGGGGLEQLGQVGGGHEGPSYGLGWSAPESVSTPEMR